jgi:cytochrome oxidase Cu insertion factor (SCO1/SenC/PrrC family)
MASLDSLSWSAFHLNHTDGKLEHSTRFAIVDKSGQIRHYVGTEEGDPVAEVLATIRRLGMQG